MDTKFQFEKVRFSTFVMGVMKDRKMTQDAMSVAYDSLTLPKRATYGSAGYDFVIPYTITIPPKSSVMIPTGVKCKLTPGFVLLLFPRSSVGIKKSIMLNNTVGVIDSDYYNNPDNEGHIFAKLYNYGDTEQSFSAGDKFMQGIITKFYVTDFDDTTDKRVGGIGSTK